MLHLGSVSSEYKYGGIFESDHDSIWMIEMVELKNKKVQYETNRLQASISV